MPPKRNQRCLDICLRGEQDQWDTAGPISELLYELGRKGGVAVAPVLLQPEVWLRMNHRNICPNTRQFI